MVQPGKYEECACDMRGMLSFLILWIISRGPAYGQKIADDLEKRKGRKPTPGTLYPALKELKRRGMIKSERKGKTVFYSITPRGTAGLDSSCNAICAMFSDIVKEKMG
jgi:PadR family transcriptional regulator, regulatory protein PadR